MTTNIGSFDWQLFEENDEDVWDDLKDELNPRSSLKLNNLAAKPEWQHYGLMSMLICVAFVSGLWLWYQAQLGNIYPVEELSQLVATDNKLSHTQVSPNGDQTAGPHAELNALDDPDQSTVRGKKNTAALASTVNIESIEQIGDRALAEVLIEPDNREGVDYTLREFRFYRHTESGWQLTAPVPAFWGAKETIDTTHFHLEYYERDSSAVLSAASRADRLYQAARQSMGLTSAPERLTFEIVLRNGTKEQSWSASRGSRVIIPSPLLVAKPIDVSDADLLYQLMADFLIERATQEAVASHSISAPWEGVSGGLMLWQLWQIDGPLSDSKTELLSWIFGLSDENAATSAPESYVRTCEYFLSIQKKSMPILYHCVGGLLFSSQPQIALQLLDLPTFLGKGSEDLNAEPVYIYTQELIWKSASYASLFNYVDHRFGPEGLPVMLAALNEHRGWSTLIPALFDLSVAEFDAGWEAFRQQQYQ